jgi:metal-responsive CopG/Arc/MetJ family transcriptional regulator
MATQLEKITVSVPSHLKTLADQVARENRISRSKVVSNCLNELAEKRRITLMEEGYRVMAEEHERFAETASKISLEVILPWDE